jgi:hypothetical protein
VEPASTPSTKKAWRNSLPIDMLLSAVSVLVVAQSSSEIPEGLMNNPVCSIYDGLLDSVIGMKLNVLLCMVSTEFQRIKCRLIFLRPVAFYYTILYIINQILKDISLLKY